MYETRVRADGFQEEEIAVQYTEEGKRATKPLDAFLKENVSESKHEIIRTNVVTATRTFDHRVKVFVREYMIGNAAGMQVEFYSYKVEFQQRGAGHVHGVLWLMTDVLERTEWIKEPNTDQSRAQTDPRVPVVTETISNEDVRVYSEEEFNQISDEEKNQMNSTSC